jgi:ParB family chromosome partitioning protein
MLEYTNMEHSRSSDFHKNAVFFIEVEKVNPNPYQPRREFDQARLQDLAESIKMYGVLQPLVVTRKEVLKPDGGLTTEYELIAGERRLRASKLAGLREVPALIRAKEDDDKTKLELAIIENLQREDLNPIDRAVAFEQLSSKFKFKHAEIAKKVGKSREYVSNSIRILALPEEVKEALSQRKISEGHARPLLMLSDRPEEQNVLFKEIVLRRMTVRDAEKISRKIAFDKVRKKERMFDPEIIEMEEGASQNLGARVTIEPKDIGGRIRIDYFSDEELKKIMTALNEGREEGDEITKEELFSNIINSRGEIGSEYEKPQESEKTVVENTQPQQNNVIENISESILEKTISVDNSVENSWQEQSPEENSNIENQSEVLDTPDYSGDDEDDEYSIKNFNI